jgi:hypothetical protein
MWDDRAEAQQEVLLELIAMRKADGKLSVAKVAEAPRLAAILGAGDPRVALRTFLAYLRADPEDRDLRAAAITLGLENGGATKDRFDAAEAQLFAGNRSIRRWSDDGLKKLSVDITSADVMRRPVIRLNLSIRDEEVLVVGLLYFPVGTTATMPLVDVNMEPIDFATLFRSTDEDDDGALKITFAGQFRLDPMLPVGETVWTMYVILLGGYAPQVDVLMNLETTRYRSYSTALGALAMARLDVND